MPERTIVRLAAARGRRVWRVGGPVRDRLLGLAVRDVDLAIDGAVREIGRRAARTLGGTFRWHPRFLTGRIDGPQGPLDLARTRRESYAGPAALPTVRPGTIEQDLGRRDFTINAMALEIGARGDLELLDPFRGRSDLHSRLVRILHDDSFVDDPTRAFRALRFAVRLRFRLERGTRLRLEEMVAARLHHRLSGQRVAAELRHAFREARAAEVLRAFARAGLDSAWGKSTLGSQTRHAFPRLAKLHPAPHLGFALAFGHLPPAKRRRIAEKLKLRRNEKRALVEGIRRAAVLIRALEQARGRSALDAPCHAADEDTVLLAAALAESRTAGRIRRWWHGARRLRLAIDGHDLRDAGIPPGPRVARGLAAARAALLGGRAPDRESQLRAALRA